MGLPELIVVQTDPALAEDPTALAVLVEKAVYLRKRTEVAKVRCQIDLVTVVYEPLVDWRIHSGPERERLKRIVVEHAQQRLEAALAECLSSMGGRYEQVKAIALWGERPWRAVLDHAQSQCADLIIRPATDFDQHGRVRKSPDEWQLVRHTSIPVLLASMRQWHEPTAVVVALDTFAKPHDPLNAILLEQARVMSQLLFAHVYVISTFPPLRPLIVELGLFEDYSAQQKTLAREGTARVNRALEQAGITDAVVDVRDGEPTQVIREVVDRLGPAIVVLGTHARSGVAAALLGNTSEKLIHDLMSDMLVVPKDY